MRKFFWRIMFLTVFLPLAIPWVVFIGVQLMLSTFWWILCGADERRTDKIMQGSPAACWLIAPLDWLWEKQK